MIEEGQIVLFPFPQTDQASGKLRPALVLRQCPGRHDDWLICMISSQLRHEIPGTDEVVRQEDPEFAQTGLKLPSVIRVTRLAVVQSGILQGVIGALPGQSLSRIRSTIANWLCGATPGSGPSTGTGTEQSASGDSGVENQ